MRPGTCSPSLAARIGAVVTTGETLGHEGVEGGLQHHRMVECGLKLRGGVNQWLLIAACTRVGLSPLQSQSTEEQTTVHATLPSVARRHMQLGVKVKPRLTLVQLVTHAAN